MSFESEVNEFKPEAAASWVQVSQSPLCVSPSPDSLKSMFFDVLSLGKKTSYAHLAPEYEYRAKHLIKAHKN